MGMREIKSGDKRQQVPMLSTVDVHVPFLTVST